VCTEKVGCIGVFLLAENRLLREALARVLDNKNDIRVVAAVAYDSTVTERVRELGPRIVALDSSVFALIGLDIITSVRCVLPDIKILLVGMDNDKGTFLRCVRAGVSGYVLKEASANEVAAAVRSVANDGAVCPSKFCAALFEQIANPGPQLYRAKAQLGLTRREQQLVKMVGQGLSNKEIANQLNLSEQTVKNHIHRMLRKVGASDRLSAVEVCRVEGIVA
jgi:two-component system, NarL family, response regulator DevR